MATRTISPERLQAVLVGILRERRTPMDSVWLSRLVGADVAEPSECYRALAELEGVRVSKSKGLTTFLWVGE